MIVVVGFFIFWLVRIAIVNFCFEGLKFGEWWDLNLSEI